jgi:protein O-mannosyl-transferase
MSPTSNSPSTAPHGLPGPTAAASGLARWSETTLVSFLILFSVLPYCNSLLNGFVYDDTTQILDNPYILSFRYLPRIFTTAAWSYVGSGGYTNYYRPVMTFGYLLCFQIFGAAPYGFHLANVFLHALVVCMLYVLTRRMFGSRAVAFLAAALFALHPMHTESVDWVAAVTDIDVTLFFLLTFWFFLRVPKPEGKRSEWAILGMAASFLLALCSKEQALMLPFLATVYEHFYRDDRGKTKWREKVSRYYLLGILTFTYFLFREHMFGAFAPIIGHSDVTRYQAFLSGIALLGEYIWKLLWPAALCAFYMFHPSTSPLDPSVLAGVAMVLGGAVLMGFLWRRHRAASFGLLWFMATIAPVLNVRVLASDNVFAERYLYLPSVGFCWLAAIGLMKLWQVISARSKAWRWAWVGCLGALAALGAARIVTRNRVWRNEITFYTVTLQASPDAAPIYNNLGSVYWNRGDVGSAEREWEKALSYVPESPTLLNNLGLVYMKRQELPQAVEYFKKSAANKPAFPDPHLNLGVAYERMGRKGEAEAQYVTAISLAPLNLHIHNRLGGLYLNEGRIQDAEKQFLISTSIAPNVVAYDALGEIMLRRSAGAAAEEMFARSISLNPADAPARLNLAALYLASGRKAAAVEQYRSILKFDPHNAGAREALEQLSQPSLPNNHGSKR